jgi:hypothetical protein
MRAVNCHPVSLEIGYSCHLSKAHRPPGSRAPSESGRSSHRFFQFGTEGLAGGWLRGAPVNLSKQADGRKQAAIEFRSLLLCHQLVPLRGKTSWAVKNLRVV